MRSWLRPVALAQLGAAVVALQEEVLSVQPLIVAVKDFASAEECQELLHLIERCHQKDWSECRELRSRLHSASNGTGSSGKRPWRNSTSFMLELPGELDGAVDALVRRSHILARHPITSAEGVQVASYQAGDYYEFHHDSLKRRATVLLYLNDVPEGDGGETIFPLIGAQAVNGTEAPLPPAVLGHHRQYLDYKVERMEDMVPYCESSFYLKVRPEMGKAVMFFSYRPDYSMDEYTIHGACPLKRGRKAIFQRWMRFEENALFGKSGPLVHDARTLWGHERLLQPAESPSSSSSSTRRPHASTLRASTPAAAGADDEVPGGPAMLRASAGQVLPEL